MAPAPPKANEKPCISRDRSTKVSSGGTSAMATQFVYVSDPVLTRCRLASARHMVHTEVSRGLGRAWEHVGAQKQEVQHAQVPERRRVGCKGCTACRRLTCNRPIAVRTQVPRDDASIPWSAHCWLP